MSQEESASLSLTKELMRRASVTPEDSGCQLLMATRLESCGFDITHLPFDEVSNLWAVHGSEGPLFCFAGHTDVVPVGRENEWSHPPFAAQVDGEFLRGRGAADMKASLAAMLIASERFVADYPNHTGRLAFLITSDEEGPAVNGTVKVVEWLEEKNEKISWCLVGEPSSTTEVGDIIKNGRRGSLGANLRVIGKQGHVAYPHLADNPIHAVAPALAELANTHWDEGNDFFPPTSFQVSNINSGTGATNVIPGEAQVVFNFRYSTETTAQDLKSRVEAIFKTHELNYDITWTHFGEPFLTAEGDLVDASTSAIKQVTGRDTQLSTAGGTSDGRFIAPTGAQVLELGPVNATIHQTNECVKVVDIDTLTEIYYAILVNLLGK